MLHNPKTLFLDEPTIGLDVLVKRNLIEAINKLRNEYNTTLILTTHAMSDIELLCKRVIVLDAGKILFDGSLEEVKHMFGDKRDITIMTDTEIAADGAKEKFGEAITRIATEDGGLKTTFTVDEQKLRSSELLNWLLSNYLVKDVKITETGIEQVVEKIYENNKIGAAESGGGE